MNNGTNSNNTGNIVVFNELTLPNENEMKDATPCLYYDSISKKFIGVLNDRIELFNKKKVKLHQDIKIGLSKQQIQAITVETNYEYLMLLAATRNKAKNLLIINLRKGEVIKIIHIENSNSVKEMLFLSQSNAQIMEFVSTNFCLIFQSQIFFYSIDKTNDCITARQIVTYSNSIKIEDSIYNNVYMVHCVVRSDYSFDFYNYVNEAFYDKSSRYSYRKFKIGQKSKTNNSNININGNRTSITTIPIQSIQFFLQVLHKELYFIVFDVDNCIITLHHTKKLNDINKVMDISIPKNIVNASLLFVNDLVLVLNMNNWEIIVLDINLPSKNNKIITKFTYSNILSMDLNQISIIRGNILKHNQLFYSVSINYKTFYESVKAKSKQKAIMILIEKKGTKDLIYKCVREMIQNKQKAKYINEILLNLVMQIVKSIKPPQELLLINKDSETALDVITPLSFLLKRHKRLMKQIDLFYLFQSLQDCIGLEYDIIRYYMIFSLLCKWQAIRLQPNFTNVLLVIIKRMPIEMCYSLFKYLPENEELAVFLLEKSTKMDKGSVKMTLWQKAFDILMRLNKGDMIFEQLSSQRLFKEAMFFYIRNRPNLSLSSIKSVLSLQIKSNKRLMLQFINQN